MANPNDLWSLLARFTVRKCANRAEYWRAQRRDTGREVARGPSDEALETLKLALDPGPTPEDVAVLLETAEQLLKSFDAGDRAIVELSLQGHTAQEISEQLGQAERTVQRVRERVKQRLQRLQTD